MKPLVISGGLQPSTSPPPGPNFSLQCRRFRPIFDLSSLTCRSGPGRSGAQLGSGPYLDRSRPGNGPSRGTSLEWCDRGDYSHLCQQYADHRLCIPFLWAPGTPSFSSLHLPFLLHDLPSALGRKKAQCGCGCAQKYQRPDLKFQRVSWYDRWPLSKSLPQNPNKAGSNLINYFCYGRMVIHIPLF